MQISCFQKEKSAGLGMFHVEDAWNIRFHATLHLDLSVSASHSVHWFTRPQATLALFSLAEGYHMLQALTFHWLEFFFAVRLERS